MVYLIRFVMLMVLVVVLWVPISLYIDWNHRFTGHEGEELDNGPDQGIYDEHPDT